MEKLILTLHIIVCVILVILVLLQSGKEGMGVIFGGGSSSLFGSTGAGGILVKLTTFMAVIFLATSLGYNMVSSAKTSRHSNVIDIPLDDPSAPAKPLAPANATIPTSDATLPRQSTTGPVSSNSTETVAPAQSNSTAAPQGALRQAPSGTSANTEPSDHSASNTSTVLEEKGNAPQQEGANQQTP